MPFVANLTYLEADDGTVAICAYGILNRFSNCSNLGHPVCYETCTPVCDCDARMCRSMWLPLHECGEPDTP